MPPRVGGRSAATSTFQFDEMTRTERVMAAVRGEPVDRLPICFWHHFQPAGSGRRLAEASLRFFDETFDLDIVKVMPDIPYPFPRRSLKSADDWRLLEPIDPARSRFVQQRAEAVHVLRDELGFDTPIIVTLFSPLCEALYFAADRDEFLRLAQESPAVVHEALATIAENLRAHIADVIAAGADGVFFALQGCSTAVMPAGALPRDRPPLRPPGPRRRGQRLAQRPPCPRRTGSHVRSGARLPDPGAQLVGPPRRPSRCARPAA